MTKKRYVIIVNYSCFPVDRNLMNHVCNHRTLINANNSTTHAREQSRASNILLLAVNITFRG